MTSTTQEAMLEFERQLVNAGPINDTTDLRNCVWKILKELEASRQMLAAEKKAHAHDHKRADLVAKPYAWLFEPHPVRLFFEAPRDPSGWLALYTEDALRAELSRASATAQEPADTKAVMAEFERRLNNWSEAVLSRSTAVDSTQWSIANGAVLTADANLKAFVQRLIPAPSVAEPCAVEKGSHPWELRLIFETAEDAAKAYSAYSDSTKLASSRAPSVAEPAKCWCAHCERVQIAELPAIDRIFSRKFIVCPDCGNKRCPKATCHERACSGSNDPDQIGSRYGTDIPCGVHPASPDCTPASAEQASAASSSKQCVCGLNGLAVCSRPQSKVFPDEITGVCILCNHPKACHTERKER